MLEATIRQSLGGRAPLEEGLKFLLVTEADQGQLVLELFVHEGASTVLIVRAEAQLQELERLVQQRRKRHVPAEIPSPRTWSHTLPARDSDTASPGVWGAEEGLRRIDDGRGNWCPQDHQRGDTTAAPAEKEDATPPNLYLGFAT